MNDTGADGQANGSAECPVPWVDQRTGRREIVDKLAQLCEAQHKKEHMDIFLCAVRTADCISGACGKCGFEKFWRELREDLVTTKGKSESISADAPEHFKKILPLERYISVTGSKKKAVSAEESEDPTYGSTQGSSSRLETEVKKESVVWILDYLESLFPQMCHHRTHMHMCIHMHACMHACTCTQVRLYCDARHQPSSYYEMLGLDGCCMMSIGR